MNVPPKIGQAISRDYRLIESLNTVLGLEDLEDILEVMTVDAYNAKILAKKSEKG